MDRSEIESSAEQHPGREVTPGASGETLDSTADETPWHPLQRWAFRFGCIYFLWYAIPDFAAGRDTFLSRGMDRLAAWCGEHVFGLGEVSSAFTSSGDMTVNYVKLWVMLAGSLAGSLVWTLLDHRRRHDRLLSPWLKVAVRYYVMLVMVGYGLAKVFPSQFPPPGISRLLQSFGDASPMGLLWTAIGHSRAYAAFAGLGEIIGGLLLGFRRTTTLGALVIVVVMSNVVMMNFSYDVPVKIYSSHLLVMALALVASDWRRVINVLVLNRPAAAATYPPHFTSPIARKRALAVKMLIIGLMLFLNVRSGLESERLYGRGAPEPPLYGLYDVETFAVDGELLPPLLTDDRRWQNVIFDRRRQGAVRMMDGTMHKATYHVEGANRLSIFRDDQDGPSFTRTQWIYTRPSRDILSLESEVDGETISVRMRARDPKNFLLLNRGFHWVNETPFNP